MVKLRLSDMMENLLGLTLLVCNLIVESKKGTMTLSWLTQDTSMIMNNYYIYILCLIDTHEHK